MKKIQLVLPPVLVCLYGCSELVDIFPPDIKIDRPYDNEMIQDNIQIDLNVEDMYDIDKVSVYTVTEYGDIHREMTLTNEDYNESIPIWTRSTSTLRVKAWDANGNHTTENVSIRMSRKYDMDFEDDDEFTDWFFNDAYSTEDDKYYGAKSALFYSEDGSMGLSRNCRSGTLSFSYRRASGCYYNQPPARLLIDGKEKWNLEGGFIANDDAWYRVEIKVDEGYHNFRWEFEHVCSNYDFLLIDAIHLP
tara:strand:+ start:262 stop:1005 length:744 start_codon:yes stop_codon:yes gene_type:complete